MAKAKTMKKSKRKLKKIKRSLREWKRFPSVLYFLLTKGSVESELKKLEKNLIIEKSERKKAKNLNSSLENKKLKEEIKDLSNFRRRPSLSEESAEFVYLLLHKVRPKKILEIGTGYSTLVFAKYCKKNDSNLVSYDIDRTSQSFTLENLRKLNLNKNVELRNGSVLSSKLDSFDLVFIDGYQREYKDYLELALKLNPKLIVADNLYLPLVRGISEYKKELKKRKIKNADIKVGKGLNVVSIQQSKAVTN